MSALPPRKRGKGAHGRPLTRAVADGEREEEEEEAEELLPPVVIRRTQHKHKTHYQVIKRNSGSDKESSDGDQDEEQEEEEEDEEEEEVVHIKEEDEEDEKEQEDNDEDEDDSSSASSFSSSSSSSSSSSLSSSSSSSSASATPQSKKRKQVSRKSVAVRMRLNVGGCNLMSSVRCSLFCAGRGQAWEEHSAGSLWAGRPPGSVDWCRSRCSLGRIRARPGGARGAQRCGIRGEPLLGGSSRSQRAPASLPH